jgi:epoxyqueuosine reductase
MDLGARNRFIKEEAKRLGFEACGIAQVSLLEKEKSYLENYLKHHRHASMQYMENHIEKRLNPALLVDDAKSVISVLYNYYYPIPEDDRPYKVSMYARGADYHYVIKSKLQELADSLTKEFGTHKFRVFTDSAPVLEKSWAVKAGLGWIGKNTCLINRGKGSFFFLGELVTTLEAIYDEPEEERCGTCTRCLEACPTGALTGPGEIDAGKCISYLTIEHKGEFTDEMPKDFRKYIFGCDICQQVCPWNRFSKAHDEPLFNTTPFITELEKYGITSDSANSFRRRFKNTPLERTGEKNLIRNIRHIDRKVHK